MRALGICTLMVAFGLVLRAAEAESTATSLPQKVTIELFSDFQCPFCRHFAESLRPLQAQGAERVDLDVVFKNFPLSFHPDAELAARTALAAEKQGKFWEMHDLLFANQQALKRDDLTRYAETLGLDTERFRADLESEQLAQRIAADKAEGEARGVSGTPAFSVNGRMYSGTKTTEELRKLVQDERARIWALSEVTDERLSKGPADAPVVLELFADLQSPVSIPAMQMVDGAVAKYHGAVRVQFRNFPLAFHRDAPMAHAAAMTAARYGRFWEFAAYILAHQDSLREQDLFAYAGELGLDANSFAEMVRDRRYAPRVDADLAAGVSRGVRGSPVIFVNGRRIDGVPDLRVLTQYVEEELAAKP